MNFFLTGVSGPTAGKEFVILGEEIFVGRAENNDVCIDDTSIASSHARLYRRGDFLWVLDLTREGRLRVNGQLLEEGPLTPNDVLQIGNCGFVVGIEVDSETTMAELKPEALPRMKSLLSDLRRRAGNPNATRVLLAAMTITAAALALSFIPSKEPVSSQGNTTQRDSVPDPRIPSSEATSASTDEFVAWRARVKSALLHEDFRTAVLTLKKMQAARPGDSDIRTQLSKTEAKLNRLIQAYYEGGAREYENLYFENAVREWRKVLALSKDLDPEMHARTETKIREAEQKLISGH